MKHLSRSLASLVATVLTAAAGLAGCGDGSSDADAMPGATQAGAGTQASTSSKSSTTMRTWPSLVT